MAKQGMEAKTQAVAKRMTALLNRLPGKTEAERARDAVSILIATRRCSPETLFAAVTMVGSRVLGGAVTVVHEPEPGQGGTAFTPTGIVPDARIVFDTPPRSKMN